VLLDRRVTARLRRHPGALVGGILVFGLAAMAVLGPALAPYDPATLHPAGLAPDGSPQPPGGAHPLGTDALGRDFLSRLLHGGRTSLLVAVVATAISLAVGTLVGVASGYLGGVVDAVAMRLVDALLALPFLLIAIATRRAVADPGIVILCLLLGLLSWTTLARVVRARAMEVRGLGYVLAARALGAGEASIVWTHVLPNVAGTILVLGTTLVARMVLFESAMSFLGLGVQPPQASWGGMVAEGLGMLARTPRLVLVPGGLIVAAVFGFSLLGEALRDVLEPSR